MSQEARDKLCNALIFQQSSQRGEIRTPTSFNDDGSANYATHTNLIGLLSYLVFDKGWPLEITCLRDGHHEDGPLGHNPGGLAADCWPLNSKNPGDYTDAADARFQRFLADAASAPFMWQLGLAGTAITGANMAAAGGPNYAPGFADTGDDHIHLGAKA